MKYICCFSGGKDSTAMLIHIIENDLPLDEIIYCDLGDWVWESANDHIQQVKEKLGVEMTIIDLTEDLKTGFMRWGFPSMFNRWCTGFKKDRMREYLRDKYPNEEIIQYVGYCADEEKRTSRKLYSSYEGSYPLVDAGITTSRALEICKEHGFDFGGVYEHHHHFNCWLCPLQKVAELEYVFNECPDYWDQLRSMQHQCDGYYQNGKTIFEYEQRFWEKNCEKNKENRMKSRKKYNKNG